MMHFRNEDWMQKRLVRDGKLEIDKNFRLDGDHGPRGRHALKYLARQIGDYLRSLGIANPHIIVDLNNYTLRLDKDTHNAYRSVVQGMQV